MIKGFTAARTAMLATALTAALTLAACGKDENESGKVLATVNGDKIYESAVNAQLGQIPADLLQTRGTEIRRQVLDRLIEQKLLEQEAVRMDIESDPEFKKQLGLLTQQLEAQAVVARKVSETITPAKLAEVYEATKQTRAFPAVRARHILVKTKAEAETLIGIATPANFAELAKTRSEGPSKDNGGELGWFRREAMIPEFANVAFATPVNTVAKTPVQTQFGWHVILVEERNDAYVPPLEQVEGALRQELGQTVVQGYLTDLRKNATVSYSDQPESAASPTTVK